MASTASLLVLMCFLTYCATTLQAYSSYLPTTSDPSNRVLNIVDSCWRTNWDWASNRKAIADCAIGFGKDAMGGKYGEIYEVTNPSDDPINPKPGTL
ncbi:hypothetical protein L1049_021956 [Liquidambar formosana]|uniref:Uncharacterized protein n=1 Tax=Liquidambar formosana TaxID=63359 RepID=A0AAP0WQF2_LIQFO